MVVAPRMWRGDTSHLTSFSIDGECTSDTLSERRESILPPSVAILMGGYSRTLTGNSRASSSTCFQPWLRPSRSGDPEVPTTRRDGPEEVSEPRSNRLALYRFSHTNFREFTFHALG